MDERLLHAIDESLAATDAVKRVSWTPEQLKNYFARRTANEIRSDGTTHYGNPCVDLTPVLKQALQERGYDSTLYVEVVENKLWIPEGVIALHFGLGISDNGGLHYLHIKSHNQAVLGKGMLPPDNREEVTRLHLYVLPGPLDPDKNLFDNYPGMQKKLPVCLDGEVERLIASDSPQEYENYQRRLNGSHHLYLEHHL